MPMSRRAAALTARKWFHAQLCMSGCDGTDHAVVLYRAKGRAAAACVTLEEFAVVAHANLCHPHCERAEVHAPRFAQLRPVREIWSEINPAGVLTPATSAG